MKDLATRGINAARSSGATYADIRFVDSREESLATKNGVVAALSDSERVGCGIRVVANGAWGFASSQELTREAVEKTARQAVAVARASALVKKKDLLLAPEEGVEAAWRSPCLTDPFTVPLEEKLGLLLSIDELLRRQKGITLTETSMGFVRTHKLFMNSQGSCIDQVFIQSGAGYTAYSFTNGELQRRSYPTSFGGQHQLKGYELIEELALLQHAERVAEEAVALHRAPQCPRKRTDLILEGSQLALQIHESIGHAIELDRVLGYEANYAGTSFLTPEDLGRLQYGSPHVTVVADATLQSGPGVGSFGYDDEGVPAQIIDVIRDGIFVGFLTSRETVPRIGLTRSSGAMRAEGWNRIPLIRMTNVNLLPGTWSVDGLIADTDDGIYMETNRSWSIDDRRLQFQFGTEIAYEIKNGKKGRMFKNPSYAGITTEFWRSCDAVCDRRSWVLWGVPTCGKGQPGQAIATGHGASPARFRGVDVGVAYAE